MKPGVRNAIIRDLGRKSTGQIGAKLGLTSETVRVYAKRMGLNPRQDALRFAGMSVADVAAALGVHHTTAAKWTRRAGLPSQRASVRKKDWFVSIDADALLDWLRAGNALNPAIRPTDSAWREIVDEIRADLRARWVTGPVLLEALGFSSRGGLIRLQRAHGFPVAVFSIGGPHPDYHDRAAVAAWMDAHPEYRTKAIDTFLGAPRAR